MDSILKVPPNLGESVTWRVWGEVIFGVGRKRARVLEWGEEKVTRNWEISTLVVGGKEAEEELFQKECC